MKVIHTFYIFNQSMLSILSARIVDAAGAFASVCRKPKFVAWFVSLHIENQNVDSVKTVHLNFLKSRVHFLVQVE